MLTMVAVLLFSALALPLTWHQTSKWEDRQVSAALASANQTLDARYTQTVIDFTLAMSSLKGLPEFIAAEPRMIHALEQPRDRALVEEANNFFYRVSDSLAVNVCLLIDAHGMTLASSNNNNYEQLSGTDLSDRKYFKTAMQGQPGREFAVGRRSGIPGFFFSYPVRSSKAAILGVVVVKLDLANLANRMRLQGVFIEDEHGVVVVAQQRELLFSAVEGASILKQSDSERRSLYKRSEFPRLPLLPGSYPDHPEIVLFGDQQVPSLHRTASFADEGMTIHLIEELDPLPAIHASHEKIEWLASVGVLAALWGLCGTVIFALRAKLHRRSIEAANTELLSLNEQLKIQADTDSLTDCMNRRRFNAVLDQEVKRSHRQQYPLTLAMIDLDHFKRINDSHGHLVGDAALQHFAHLVRGQIRQTDYFARLGGEEFTLLMPDTEPEAGMALVERLREGVASQPLPVPSNESLKITASIGLGGLAPNEDGESLLRRADDAMYAAKSAGRDRVVLASRPETGS